VASLWIEGRHNYTLWGAIEDKFNKEKTVIYVRQKKIKGSSFLSDEISTLLALLSISDRMDWLLSVV